MTAVRPIEIIRYEDNVPSARADDVAAEEPLEVRIEGHPLAVLMRTPGHDRELAAGLALTEGIIRSAKDIFDITSCVPSAAGKGNAVDIGLTHPGAFDPAKFSRHILTSASCGVCSKASIDQALKRRKPLQNSAFQVAPHLLLSLPRKLAKAQTGFRQTGGLHACALFDLDGALLAAREDVGRHNALDKLIGWAVLEKRLPLSEHLLLLSGRTSFEMVQKAHAAGIALIIAISAPSSLAVEFARESRQTLIGFARGRSMNVYSKPERIGV